MIKNSLRISDKVKDENLLFLLDLCRETTKCVDCGIFLVDHEKDSFQPLSARKTSRSLYQKIKSHWGKEIILEKLNNKKPILIGKNEIIFVVPLSMQDKVTGFFAAFFSDPDQLSDDENYRKLVLFSRQINSYLENLQLKEFSGSKDKIINFWQKELLPMKKMASVGALTRDFTHDVNNPLQIILGKAQILAMRMKKEAINKKYVDELKIIEKNAQRISCLTKKLSDFAKRGENDSVSSSDVNLDHLIKQTFLLVKNRFKSKGIEFQLESREKLPSVKGNPHQLEQVFLDLFLNAQKSMPKGGMLTVNLKKEKSFLKLDFTDTGEKIPEKFLPEIFDPSSSAPEVKRRLHPGFFLSHKIIRDHKGEMLVLGNKNKGNIFRLKLPIIS